MKMSPNINASDYYTMFLVSAGVAYVGMAMGFISYAFTMVVAGKRKEVHPLIYGLCVVFLTYLILL